MDLEHATIQQVAIEQLTLSPDYQLRERLEPWKVEEYAAVFDRLPPVLVARLAGALYLVDGRHRLAAAGQLGRQTLPARIVETDADSAFALAVRANAAHGLPLKTKEKKAAARGLLLRFGERSDRWIAEDVGLSHSTVIGLRSGLEAGGRIGHLGYSLGQDGKRYACDCARCRPALRPVEPAAPEPAHEVGAEAAEPSRPALEAVRAPNVCASAERAPVGRDRDEPAAPLPHGVSSREPVCEASHQASLLRFPPPDRSVPDRPAPDRPAATGDPLEVEGAGPARAAQAEATQARELDPLDLALPEGAELVVVTAGPVTIWHGDARELTEWGLAPVHLVVTSPPYNVGTDYGQHCDELPQEDYCALLAATWRACYSVMASGARIAVVVPFGVGRNPWAPLAARVAGLLCEAGFTLRGQIVWDKGTSGGRTTWGSFRLPTDPSLRDTTEAILIAHKDDGRLPLPPGVAQHDSEGAYSPLLADQALFMELAQDHWLVPPESATRVGHPAPFPVGLPERLIRFYAYPGAHVLDPFAGSGATGVAALRLGCRATLVDIDQDYCCLAEERCRQALAAGEGYGAAG